MFEFFASTIPEHTSALIGIGGVLFASFTSLFSVVNPLAISVQFILSGISRYLGI